MNVWLLAAGVAALVLDLVHIFPGGREIHRPMVASHWPEPAKAVWSVVWHAATAVMALGGVALIAAGLLPDQALALAVLPVALFLSAAALFLFYGLKRLGTVWILLQWVGFLGISALALVGLA
jgi:predicted small integral membrane protein